MTPRVVIQGRKQKNGIRAVSVCSLHHARRISFLSFLLLEPIASTARSWFILKSFADSVKPTLDQAIYSLRGPTGLGCSLLPRLASPPRKLAGASQVAHVTTLELKSQKMACPDVS
ncbi:unnamed protein product [Protopolystoma xenopodis]|uniref:Uncharacterized protein n=1 Tax=Protopolystoma xenopodis TaxID=117903 RepID=A0A448XL37_9PLAT|nr:unnamed protein product [Protopolystoma xenopodis]